MLDNHSGNFCIGVKLEDGFVRASFISQHRHATFKTICIEM